MSWKIVIAMRGEEPSEEEVEAVEQEVQDALDKAGVDYVDLYAE